MSSQHKPYKTALLLLDYHNHIINMIQPAEQQAKLLSAVRALISAARENSVPIIHCLIDFNEPSPSSKVRERWRTMYKPLLSSTPEAAREWADFVPAAQASKNETTVTTVPGCVSAMKSKGLLPLLRDEYKVGSLIICGLVTSGAVVSTAREAADMMGFVTTVVRDGCLDHSADSHRVIMDSSR